MKDIEALKKTILSNIRLGNILQSRKIIHNSDHDEQLSCPFHGVDRKKSARYYYSTDTAYCWVCKEKWDLFSFIAKMEDVTFSQAINILVNRYNINISKVPEVAEGTVSRIKIRQQVSINQRKVSLEKLKQAIRTIRDEVPIDKYCKMTYAFAILKYLTPDTKFEDSALMLKNAILRLIKPFNQK